MTERPFLSKYQWIFVRDVQDLLGWHRSKVRRWVDQGKLPFIRDENGYARFRRDEIERFAEQRGRVVHGAPAKLAAKTFAWFAQGKTWQEVLILLANEGEPQPVEVVQTLFAQYLDDGRREAPSGGARSKRTTRAPVEEDEREDVSSPLDADAWRLAQAEEARRAQEALDREEREWEEQKRRDAEARAQRFHSLSTSGSRRAPPEEAPPPISERIVTMLQLLAAREAPR